MEEQQAELDQAEAAMWGWYLEWSKIARIAIKQRVLLKELGFLSTRSGGDDEGSDGPPPPVPSPTPAPGASPAVSGVSH